MENTSIYQKKAIDILKEVKKSIIGKDEMVSKVLMAILAGGHILIDDIPGVGKTTMAVAFAEAMGLMVNRIQFTPDLMPSDVMGFSMFNRQANQFEYREGAVMCNLLLADEINRTSPKTQSALLQVMEEGIVTVDGETMSVPDPFIVIATQNPIGSTGTQKLPESQIDRFMIKLNIGYPKLEDEVGIMKNKEKGNINRVNIVTNAAELKEIRDAVGSIYISDEIYYYIAQIAKLSREDSEILSGISPRGSIAVVNMAKAYAFLKGRSYVVAGDVQAILYDTIRHRIIIRDYASGENDNVRAITENLIKSVTVPNI